MQPCRAQYPFETGSKGARLLNSGHFISVYGPTENTTFTTTFTAPPDLPADSPVPIGWPVASTILRILDDEMRPVPEGSAGQLCVGGEGLALGYLNAPDLTRQKFIADPAARNPVQRLYLTGDLVRRDETGLLHFLGRMDNQLKVNGRRIEPEHVETVLRRHLPLTDIAVVACALTNGAKHLVAFVVPLPGASLSGAAFREAASRYLPLHMIPARLETVDAFPLTGTGKIDRLALSRQAANARALNPSNTQLTAPVEAMLIDLWRRHLQLETVDVDQNFFDLGGSSLQLLGVQAELEQLFPGRLSIRDLFDLPTIRLLHGRLSGAPAADATTQAAPHAALQRRARQNRARSSIVHANSATINVRPRCSSRHSRDRHGRSLPWRAGARRVLGQSPARRGIHHPFSSRRAGGGLRPFGAKPAWLCARKIDFGWSRAVRLPASSISCRARRS